MRYCLICDACSWRCSLWVQCVFRRVDVVCVSVVPPVAILSVVFCVICSLLMFVSDASGDHMVETYSSMGLVMALYVASYLVFVCSSRYSKYRLSCVLLSDLDYSRHHPLL